MQTVCVTFSELPLKGLQGFGWRILPGGLLALKLFPCYKQLSCLIPSPKGNFQPTTVLPAHHTSPAATHRTKDLRCSPSGCGISSRFSVPSAVFPMFRHMPNGQVKWPVLTRQRPGSLVHTPGLVPALCLPARRLLSIVQVSLVVQDPLCITSVGLGAKMSLR